MHRPPVIAAIDERSTQWIDDYGQILADLSRQKLLKLNEQIDVLKEQDVRGDGRDHRDDGGDLRVVIAQDIAEQKAGAPAFQFDIPGGEAQAVGDGGGAKAEQREAERDQARCSPLGPRSSAA